MGTAERREREKAERRAAILDVAERIFLDKGLDGTTMDDIASAAELSKGALYLYFRTKDELYVACVHRQAVECHARACDPALQAGSGREQILGVLRGMVCFARERPRHFRLAMSWLLAHSPIDPTSPSFLEHRAQAAQMMTYVEGALARGQADGSIRRDLSGPRTVAYLWASTVGVLLADLNQEGVRQRMADRVEIAGLAEAHLEAVAQFLAGDRS